MDWTTLFQEENGIVAWGVAFLIAAGGTAVVMALWWQFRKGVPQWFPVQGKTVSNPSADPTYAGPATVPAPSTNVPREPLDPLQALRAYREMEADNASPTQAAEPNVDQVTLTDYLKRLHQAADRLEHLANQRKPDQQQTPDFGAL